MRKIVRKNEEKEYSYAKHGMKFLGQKSQLDKMMTK